ncbi:pogo transposable element with KRAB domain [Octopus vulgaris]|uniref:Pogo transposable element with KRAB domain n=1 Tax=Octopus vulgaris TaxID=6645 RepID=A0AA36ASQ7_OCTVU|nr:pogo transposable element with KRAB domain [Octopus vulgaris]
MNECSVHKKPELLEVFKRRNTILKLIPPKTASYLQPLDVLIIGPFKKTIRAEWEKWFSIGKKKYTNKGYRKKPSYQEIVNFVTQPVATLNKETIKRAFECCGICSS